MAPSTFLVALAAGAALVALWLVVRAPRLGPRSLAAATGHVAAALGVGWVLPLGVELALSHGVGVGWALLSLALPALTYMFLAALWLMTQLQSAMLRTRR